MLKRSDLHGYQNRAVQFIKDKHGAALFLDMGLGKTISSLTAMADLYDDFEVERFLVIAPLRVANTVWHKEASEWEHTKHLDFAICTGTLQARLEALNKKATITVINRENIPWLVEHYKSKFPFKMIVIDESSSFKNGTSKRFRALKKIMKFVDRCVLLTGTPASNGYIDLWSQFYLLDMGARLGFTLTMFRNSYFDTGYMGYTYTLKTGAMHTIQNKISDIVLSMTSDDYLELPENIPSVLTNKLTGNLLKEYLKFEKDALLNLGGDEQLTAVSAAVLTNKLLQFCSGAVYDDAKNVHYFHELKFETLDEIIETNPDENLLVAYNYKHELERLIQRYPQAVVMDKGGKAVADWNAGKIKMLLVHPKCVTGDTEVLTEHSGWVKITEVKITDRVYDGVEFVAHSGCIYSGTKEVIDTFGIESTKDHKFLINDKWVEAQDVRVSEQEASYRYNGSDSYICKMLQMHGGIRNEISGFQETQQTWRQALQALYKRYLPQFDKHTNMEFMEGVKIQGKRHNRYELWRSRYFNGRKVERLQRILQRYGRDLFRWFNNRTNKCEQGVCQRKLQMGKSNGTTEKQEDNKMIRNLQRGKVTFGRVCSSNWVKSLCAYFKTEQGYVSRRSSKECVEFNIRKRKEEQHIHAKSNAKPVYDLVNCGKRHRFLVRNKKGNAFIVHNSAGHGLNLQHGGSILVWFSFTWSLEEYQQLNKRLHRQGQKNVVRTIHIAVGEVEEKLMRAIGRKDLTQAGLLRSLK